ncbi:MAG: hypothetical protein IKU30_04670 [Clostridia bacterium]|nr:hypothetical protein [Clostridia bacterium]
MSERELLINERDFCDYQYRELLENALPLDIIEEISLNKYKKLLHLQDLEYDNLADSNNKIRQLSNTKFFKKTRIKKLQKKAGYSLCLIREYGLQLVELEKTRTLATIILREAGKRKNKKTSLIYPTHM